MKRLVSTLVAIGMMVSMTVLCMAETVSQAVPSKTTSDVSQVIGAETASGESLPDTFVVEITEDAKPVIQEIEKLYSFVNNVEADEPVAPIEYFPEEVRQQVTEQLVSMGLPEDYDLKQLELNEFVTVQTFGYEERFGDVVMKFKFTTEYRIGQKLVCLLGFYSGEVDENGDYPVEWITVDAQVEENGVIDVKLTKEQMIRFDEAAATAMAILSEPMSKVEELN